MLFDGRVHESSFEMMRAEGAFPRLVELVRDHPSDDAMIHRLLLELLFEMSRIQRLDRSDLGESLSDYIAVGGLLTIGSFYRRQICPLSLPID